MKCAPLPESVPKRGGLAISKLKVRLSASVADTVTGWTPLVLESPSIGSEYCAVTELTPSVKTGASSVAVTLIVIVAAD